MIESKNPLILQEGQENISTQDLPQENTGTHQKKDTPWPRTKEKPQRDGRTGAHIKIKSHTHQVGNPQTGEQ